MFSAIQVLLMVVVVVLTALSVVIGVQVFKLIKQLRQIADKCYFLVKNYRQNGILSRLIEDDLIDNQEKEVSKKNPTPPVSVGSGLRSSASRFFYRNGRTLS
ncbi:MAG: hypothetical protein PHX72_02340 [Candidatus Shapirobacteria bacterium]|nr:hypothetical protein [Candidatus Shapirobacteria bacterium]